MPQDEEPTKISLMSNCDLNKMSFIYMTTKNRFYQSRLAFSVDKIMKIMIIMLKVFIDNYANIYKLMRRPDYNSAGAADYIAQNGGCGPCDAGEKAAGNCNECGTTLCNSSSVFSGSLILAALSALVFLM